MILLSHPTGNSNVRGALHAFENANLLKEFWTCVAWNRESSLNRWLPGKIREQLCRRSFDNPILQRTRTRPLREAGRLIAQSFGVKGLTRHEAGLLCIDFVMRDLDRAVSRRVGRLRGIDAVYAYEDGARDTFRTATELGLKRIYDLPIGYWRVGRRIQAEEAERMPEWASTMVANIDSPEKLNRKDEELAMADCVVVASSFTKKTLESAPGLRAPIDVIPYGAPVISFAKPREKNQKLKVLFAGSLSQRKGLSYLLSAMEMLGDQAELSLIGKPVGQCKPLNKALSQHAWQPSLPQERLWEEMRRHDVLVLPSLFEGFGLVLLEAMACGMVVITTPNTGGPDIIEHGKDGFIVPIRSAEMIAAALEMLANDGERLESMSEAAACTARRFSWENYQASLVNSVRCVTGAA